MPLSRPGRQSKPVGRRGLTGWLVELCRIGVVSSTFSIAQILVQSHFELVSSVLALEATEPVSEPVTQMAVELINNHLISVQEKI